TADWKNPGAPWKFHAISPKADYQRFTHGLGCGDINGDGRIDIIEKGGWWEQPASLANDPIWKKHPAAFGNGGAQMYVYDVHGEVEANAPAVLYWFKLVRLGKGKVDFVPYLIDDDSGVGTQVVAGYVSNKKYPDVVVGNKKGVFVFEHEAKKASRAEWQGAQP